MYIGVKGKQLHLNKIERQYEIIRKHNSNNANFRKIIEFYSNLVSLSVTQVGTKQN